MSTAFRFWSLIFTASFLLGPVAYARLGETPDQLEKRYGKPLSKTKLGPFDAYAFNIPDSKLQLLSLVDPKTSKTEFEMIPCLDIGPEAIVTKIAGEGGASLIPDASLGSLQTAGMLSTGIVAMWAISGGSFAAFEPSDKGGTLIFASGAGGFAVLQKALADTTTGGL